MEQCGEHGGEWGEQGGGIVATVSKLCDSWHPDMSILSVPVTQFVNFQAQASNWQTVNAGSMSDGRGRDEKIVYTNPNIWTGYTYSNDTVHTLLTCLVIDSKVVCDSFDNLQF